MCLVHSLYKQLHKLCKSSNIRRYIKTRTVRFTTGLVQLIIFIWKSLIHRLEKEVEITLTYWKYWLLKLSFLICHNKDFELLASPFVGFSWLRLLRIFYFLFLFGSEWLSMEEINNSIEAIIIQWREAEKHVKHETFLSTSIILLTPESNNFIYSGMSAHLTSCLQQMKKKETQASLKYKSRCDKHKAFEWHLSTSVKYTGKKNVRRMWWVLIWSDSIKMTCQYTLLNYMLFNFYSNGKNSHPRWTWG